jgi:hypothetical protein
MSTIASRRDLQGSVVYDGRRGLRQIPPRRRAGSRDVGLIIRRSGEGYEVTPIGAVFGADPLRAYLPINEKRLFSWAQDIRATWTRHVVDLDAPVPDPLEGGMKKATVFQDRWDQSGMPEKAFQAVAARLAVAGRDLFRFLFLDDPSDWQRVEIGERLRDASRAKELSIRIASNDFFIPWPLLYTHVGPGDLADDGSDFEPRGFWGHRHLIEHELEYQPFDVAVDPDGHDKVTISVNVDTRIRDLDLPRHYAFFQGSGALACTRRETSAELEKALRSSTFSDQVVYFLCHGRGAGGPGDPTLGGAGVALSDDVLVRDIELDRWLSGRPLPTEPVVFINACQGGQLATIFYDSLARKFLEKRAKALIGPQVDIPTVFADEYARRFFGRLLGRDAGGPVRMGAIVRDLAREFFDRYRNPLGLVYSLYRGLDCFIDWPSQGPDQPGPGGGA